MPTVTLLDAGHQALAAPLEGAAAVERLFGAGLRCGSWNAATHAVSSLPQLAHSRELLRLQDEFDTVLTTRRRHHPRQAWIEPDTTHVHEELELRVVIEGRVLLTAQPPGQRHALRAAFGPGEWYALPGGWLHQAACAPGTEILSLHRQLPRPRAASA